MVDVPSDMQSVINAVRDGSTPLKAATGADGTEYWFVPSSNSGRDRTLVPIEVWRNASVPPRRRGQVTLYDAASFNRVLQDNAAAGDISIYIDRNPEDPQIVAVLNGNGLNGSGWGDFRAKIEFRPTPQWEKWRSLDGQMITQVAFAEFIEENAEDIIDPPGGKMLEIAKFLSVARSVNFRSGYQPNSGAVQFQHDTDDVAKVSAGTIDIPTSFTLGIKPVYGLIGDGYKIPARFRYRLSEGRLTLGFKLQRIESVMKDVVDEIVDAIHQGENIAFLEGRAPGTV